MGSHDRDMLPNDFNMDVVSSSTKSTHPFSETTVETDNITANRHSIQFILLPELR